MLLPSPVPVKATTLTSTGLGARASLVLASNESGYEWSGTKGGGGNHFGTLPLPLWENEDRGRWRRSYLAASRMERESRVRGMGVKKLHFKRGSEDRPLGRGS